MAMKTMAATAILAALLAAAFAQKALPNELVLTTKSELERTYLPHDLKLQRGPLRQAAESFLIATRRPGGAVFVFGCEEPAEAPVSIPSSYSVASALDMLTAIHPTHYWAVRDGVIDFLPKGNLPAALDAPVERFAWDTTRAVTLSIGGVLDLGTVKRRFAGLGLAGGVEATGLWRAPTIVNGVAQIPEWCPTAPPHSRGRRATMEHQIQITPRRLLLADDKLYKAEYQGSGTFIISKPKRKKTKVRQSQLKNPQRGSRK